jgi:hypothetical protein
MEEIFRRIHEEKEGLLDHPVFGQLEGLTLPEIKELMRVWAPLLVHIAMTFRDTNILYYRYENPVDDLQRVINDHVAVDSKHWRMMVSDIKTLGINSQAVDCESAINLIWCELGEPVRKYMYSLLTRAKQCGDCALLKGALMESAEATSEIFFSTSRRYAALYEADTGNRLRYLGAEHIDSDLNHPLDSSVFLKQHLSPEKRAAAHSIVDDHFSNFRIFLSAKYEINERALGR